MASPCLARHSGDGHFQPVKLTYKEMTPGEQKPISREPNDVENGAARHTHDTSFVQIASGSGFGYALRIRAYGSGIGRLVCTFGKALRMQECAIALRSCSFRESQRKAGRKVEAL